MEHDRVADSASDASRDDERDVAAVRDALIAERNRSMRERGRKIGGAPGAVMAGLMIALRDIYETPKRDEGVAVVDSPTEPHDVDRDGVDLAAGDIGGDGDVTIAALERRAPIVGKRRRSRTRRLG